jgi:DNA-binding beta-propeller fold protein YncE
MAVQLGSGEFTFEVNENWANLPDEITLGDVAAVGVDQQNRVYAFNRGEHPVAVFDAEGNLLRTWGEGVFHRPHGVHMGRDDSAYLTDDGDHTVRKCTFDGKVLMTLGVPDEPKPYMSGEPFHRCTHTALSPRGDLYVSDGYGNARIHKYTPDGKLLMSWGEPGTDPGQFNVPHNICCDPDGWVYVADRENHRVQVFDGDGKFETQWNNLHRPNGMCMATGRNPLLYIGEGVPPVRSTAIGPISGHASAFTPIKARCSPGSARCIPGSHRGSSPHRTASPSTGTGTSMSASSPPGYGRASRRSRRQSAYV